MPDRRPPDVPPQRLGVFTSLEAYAVGWTPSALNRAVASHRLLRLRRGVYVENGLDREMHPNDRARRHRARCSIAAALVVEGSTVTGLSAATARGWPTWAPRELACLTAPDTRSTSLRGVHLHRTGIRASARLQVAGFAITTPTRTSVDVAREHGTEAGLVVADAVMAAGLTSPDLLREECGRFIGRLGVDRARPLAELVDPKSESVLESRSRWHFAVHQLPMPESQVWLYDLDGHFLGRSDFWWSEGVIGEVDGAEKLTDPEARTAYLRRQHLLHRAHLRVVRWGARDLRAFEPTAAWLRRELAAARADPRPRRWVASPRRLGSEFAVRALLAANSDPSRGLTAGA